MNNKQLNNLIQSVEQVLMDQDEGTHKKKSKGSKNQEVKKEQAQTQEPISVVNSRVKPINVLYCQKCLLPPEYCSLGKTKAECKAWLEATHPELFNTLYSNVEEIIQVQQDVPNQEEQKDSKEIQQKTESEVQASTEQTDENQLKDKPKKKKVVKVKEQNRITINIKQRMKNKYITSIAGLEKFNINLNEACKLMSKKFASGCTVKEDGTIEIQGDISNELCEYLPEKYPNIIEDLIDVKEVKMKAPQQ